MIVVFQSYKQWKDSLPDMTWLEGLLPPPDKIDSWQQNAVEMKNKVLSYEVDPRLRQITRESYDSFRDWFEKRLDSALKASNEAEKESKFEFNIDICKLISLF